jgi:hypothetical protein
MQQEDADKGPGAGVTSHSVITGVFSLGSKPTWREKEMGGSFRRRDEYHARETIQKACEI